MGDAIDLLLTGARVLPVGAPPIERGAVAISGGRVAAVGPADELDRLAGPWTRIVRLAPGQAVTPGFNDSHQHLLSYVRSRARVPLWETRTLGEVLGAVGRAAAARPPGSWVVAVGHDQGRLAEGRHPTLAELDSAAPDNPVLIYRACSHIALANSAALALAGVAGAADPPGGRVERGPDGAPTGVLLESAMGLVSRAVVAPPVDWAGGLAEAAREYHRRGITAIGEAALGHVDGLRDMERLRAAADAGLRLRVAAMAYGAVAEQVLAEPGWRAAWEDEWLRVPTIKHFADGTLGGGTAFLTEDYGDEPGNRGWPVVAEADLEAAVERAHRAGYQVAVHAIGDAAVAMVADVYARVLARSPRGGHRHRIEHVEVVHPGLPERMATLGLVAGVQSCFTYWESGDVTRLGPGLAPWGHAWGALLRAGVALANGSDNPVLPDFHPLQGMYAAVTRRTHAGLVLAPHQAITAAEALASYTAGGAYACFDEGRTGRLAPGMLADLAVLSGDPLGPEPEALREIAVDMTVVGGEVVYARGS